MSAKTEDKGKPAGGEDIMSHHEMKPLLAFAYSKAISCAVALTDDDEAAFLLHRKMPPKKLRSVLKDEASEKDIKLASKIYFGRVKISPANLVTITVNREMPGGKWEKALRIPLRKAGYPDFRITTDADIETESEEEQDDDAPAAPGQGSGRASSARIPNDLVQRLAELMERAPVLLAQIPSAKDHIGRLAGRARDMVNAGDAKRATNAVNDLDMALRAIPDQEEARTKRVKAAAKSAEQAMVKISAALAVKAAGLLKTAQAGGAGNGMQAFFDHELTPAIQALPESGLEKQLVSLTRVHDTKERQIAMDEALAKLDSVERGLKPDPAFAGPNGNPFAGLRIAQINAAVLNILRKKLRAAAAD